MDKAKIPVPGSKTFNKSSMACEMLELDRQDGPVHYEGLNAVGPTASALTKFLKKSGQMGGGDSPCYHWGYVMLEKLRIYEGKKKTKTRLEAEQEYVQASHLLSLTMQQTPGYLANGNLMIVSPPATGAGIPVLPDSGVWQVRGPTC